MLIEFVSQYGLDLIFAVLTGFLGLCYRGLKKELAKRIREQGAVKAGLVAILRQTIYDNYNKWSERGYCPIYAREVLTDVYRQYHALGGNDVGTELYNRAMALPTEPKEGNNIISDNKFFQEH